MNTSVDSNTEKIFFNFTILNPQYIRYVHGYFFKNEHIKFVYDSIRNDFMQSDKNLEYSLSQKEIISLVKMYDEKDFVERDFIKSLLKYNPDDYTDEFVMKRYEPWVRANSLLNGLMNSYESMRDINIIDLDTVEKALGDVRRNIDTALDISLKQGNIGLDFDDIDAHDQQLEVNKISSGFDSIDQILDGGFDRKTINFWMGAPGTGKCSDFLTKIQVRNKNTEQTMEISIGEFYEMMKVKYNGKNINPSYPEPEVPKNNI